MQKISVLICTRNRAKFLITCLTSLHRQTIKPNSIIIIDNNSTDDTQNVIKQFKRNLPIKHVHERHIGLPFARNRGIKEATGDIIAFIDDDCLAQQDWIEKVLLHFINHSLSVGLVGLVEPVSTSSISSHIEYAYYYRWLLQNVHNPDLPTLLQSGNFIDFKNAAFRASFIKRFTFSASAPYGDVGDEDVEIGNRMFAKNRNIFYDPAVKVKHHYSTTISRLLVRNFWNGYSNELLLRQNMINIKNTYISYSFFDWLKISFQFNTQGFLHIFSFFLLGLFLYPLISKTGRIYARVFHKFFPQRSLIPPRG